MMAEAGAERVSLERHSFPSETTCFSSTVTSYSEGSAAMDTCVKIEPDEEDISQSAYCAEVQGFSAEETDSGLHLDTEHIKTETVMVKIMDDDGNLQLCRNAEELCPPSQQLNSSTGLLFTQFKSETGKVKIEQHSQLQECYGTGKEFNEVSYYGIKEEYADLQVNELSSIYCPFFRHCRVETGGRHTGLQSEFRSSATMDTDAYEAASYSIKEESANLLVNELSSVPCLLPMQCKSEADEGKLVTSSQLQGSSKSELTCSEAATDLFYKNFMKLENGLILARDDIETGGALEQSVVPVTSDVSHQGSQQPRCDDVTHKTKKWQCAQCRKVLKSQSCLKNHLQIHSGDKYYCLECGTAFSRPSHLQRHQLLHSGVKLYKCSECGKTFSRRDALKRHQVIHLSEKPCTYSECGKSFSPLDELKQCEHFHSSKKYKCTHCGKHYSSQNYLKRHEFIHSGLKPYKCTECGKSFSQSCNLKQHKLIHSGEKPFQCRECGKRFSLVGHLNQHQRVHFGEKPYKCGECGMCFSRGNNLKRHLLVHSGDKPYKCSECVKSFSREDRLKQHQRVHSGEKPYICSDCGKGFPREDRLKQHQFVHSGEKPYVCSECGKSFSRADRLKQHRLVHSGENEAQALSFE